MTQNKPKSTAENSITPSDRVTFFSGVSLLVVCLTYLWWQSVQSHALIKVPSLTAPNPNAYTYFKEANALIVDRKAIDAIPTLTVRLRKPTASFDTGEAKRLVDENQKALRKIREGIGLPYQEPIPIKYFDISQEDNFITLGKLLLLSARIKASKQDWQGATSEEVDVLEMIYATQLGDLTNKSVSGQTLYTNLLNNLPMTTQHLNAKQCKTAISRIETLLAREPDLAKLLTNEKWRVVTEIDECFKQLKTLKQEDLEGKKSYFGTLSENQALELRSLNQRDLMKTEIDKMDAEITNLASPTLIAGNTIQFQNFGSTDWFTTYPQTWEKNHAKIRSECISIIFHLAIQAYRVEHGRLPPSIEALSPEYVSKSYTDPLYGRGAFKLQINGSQYQILNSVGQPSQQYR